uniref:Gamma-tubulin complex component 6 n=1 Tax=Scophthalmus maximus TaxID=52904 RepID=A0A8D3DIH4_SCOMX
LDVNSITELLCALCDSSLSGVSWKRRALGGVSREGFRRSLKRRAYGALLSKLFQDGTKGSSSSSGPSATARTPPRNRVLMISFDLRVAGCREEAERLEEQLGRLQGDVSSGLSEVDAVLELLVHLAGSAPPTATSFSRDYMRRERAVLRRPPPWGYQSEELQRLEARAWGLICGEEWGALERSYGSQRLMDAPPGTGLLALRTKLEAEERFERETRMTLFGAMQHTRTADIDIRLDLPPIPSNIDVTGLAIRVPPCLDQSEDEGFQSASNLTPDSQSEPSPVPDIDVWEAVRTFEPGRRRCWESVGCPPGKSESLYLTERGREAFDQLYRLWEGEMRVVSTGMPSPVLPLPLDSQSQLVSDLLNVLIGVASTTFPLNQSVQFDVRPGVCVSGASPESVSRLLGELAQYGTYYLRLSRFSLQSAEKKGLVFQAFTGGLRKYLHYYRACVLSTPPTLSLLTISFLFRKVGRQLRYLSELCCEDGPLGAGQATFPVGVKLLSYLYNEAQNNCSNENYPVLLSLLKNSCEPYTRFVSDWVYNGVFRDVHGEFMIQVNEDYLSFRDKHFWVQGYTLISKDVEDCVPIFLKHIANDVYVCGKTINLLKICCPQHYICWSELPVPPIAVTFSLQEVEEIERDCAVYRGRMERIAKHSAISREEQVQVSQRLAEEAKKRERFEELKQHLEQEQEWRSSAKKKQVDDDFSFARELRDREKRLQALEEQLEKELIAQYSRLSEEAAHRERRAMWRVQRMRLDEARAQFFIHDRQQVAPVAEQDTEMGPLERRVGIKEVETVEPKKEDDVVVTALSTTPGQDKSEHKVVTNISDCGDGLKSLEANTQNRLDAQDNVDKNMTLPNIQGHVSSAHLKVGEPLGSKHGHASDCALQSGCVVSGVEPTVSPLPGSSYGHSSDSALGTGCAVSGVEPKRLPLPGSAHGHSSDSALGTGCAVSGVEPKRLPLPGSAHGHSSDSALGTGCAVSGVEPKRLPLPGSAHGHSSDSALGTGCAVTGVEPKRLPLPGSAHGHSSDSALGTGCAVTGVEPKRLPLPGSAHGHSSDSALGTGCAVSGVEPKRLPLPGSAHGHSSDSALGTGCAVSGVEPKRSPLPGSAYGHSSDSSLGVGCVVKSKDCGDQQKMEDNDGGPGEQLVEGLGSWAAGFGLSPGEQSEQEYLLALSAQYEVDLYEDCYNLMASSPECQLLKQVTRGPWGLPMDPTLRRATDTTAVQLSEMVSLPVLIKHSVTAPVSLVNKAVVDYFFVELGVERHFEALRHFLLMEDGEFAQSLSDLLFEKLGSGQTPGELLTPLVLNSILSKALQYSLHGDTPLAGNFTFALRFFPETFHPHAPDSLNCLELRYKVDWPLNIIITDSCMNKYNRLFSFLLQLKHMVWSLRDVWFHLKRTALVKGAGRSVQFHQLQLYRHEMQHFVKVIQGYIANQILQVSWSEFTAKLAGASDLDAIHRTHADYLNRAIFRGLLTEKAAPVMNIIHSIFSLILKFRAQLIAQAWDSQHGEAVHPSFVAMQQSYNTFKYYSHFLFKVVTKLVNRGYQPHLEDFLLRINFNNYYKDS